MRVRAMDSNGDYLFGHSASNFLVNSPAAVAQLIQTALLLFQGEWFLDTSAGVPWFTQVAGNNSNTVYDPIIKQAILNVTGVLNIVSYSSSLNTATRVLTITVTVDTQFSADAITVTQAINVVSGGGYGTGGYGVSLYGT